MILCIKYNSTSRGKYLVSISVKAYLEMYMRTVDMLGYKSYITLLDSTTIGLSFMNSVWK